jgi:hypothetical protein
MPNFHSEQLSGQPFKIILMIIFSIMLVACGSDDEDANFNNSSPFLGGGPIGNFPNGGFPGGFPGGPLINDQFSPHIIQALNSVPCPLGRLAKSFVSGPNGNANRVFGPFSEGQSFPGQVLAAYIGGNRQNGDIMIIRKLGNGFQVTGYQMELHLCIDNILVTPQRPLSNLQLRNNQPIILDVDARCAVGDIDSAPIQMTAFPGGFYNHSSPVYVGISPLGINFCGF